MKEGGCASREMGDGWCVPRDRCAITVGHSSSTVGQQVGRAVSSLETEDFCFDVKASPPSRAGSGRDSDQKNPGSSGLT